MGRQDFRETSKNRLVDSPKKPPYNRAVLHPSSRDPWGRHSRPSDDRRGEPRLAPRSAPPQLETYRHAAHRSPPGRLAAPTNDDEALKEARRKMREARAARRVRGGARGRPAAQPSGKQADQPTVQQPAIVVPPGKLAASMFWYENDPELYRLEVQAMTRRESPFRQLPAAKETDGRLAWLGQVSSRAS